MPLPSGEDDNQDKAEGEDPVPGSTPQEATGDNAAGTTELEGMSQEEARALLNALRGSEQLLPFTDQKDEAPGRTNRLRDW